MLVRIQKNKECWLVTSLSGPLYGRRIAIAEGVQLAKARFRYNSMTGDLSALFGAVFEEGVLDDIEVARSVGLNKCFRACHHEARHDPRNSGWYDPTSGADLGDVRQISAMGYQVYYSTEQDIVRDRLGWGGTLTTANTASLEVRPTAVAAPVAIAPPQPKATPKAFQTFLSKIVGRVHDKT